MKTQADRPERGRLWAGLRLIGVILSGVPVLLMLITSLMASTTSGQFRMDLFLPAELSILTFPGMLLLAAGAIRQQVFPRLSAALPGIAAAALVLCQSLACIPVPQAYLLAALLFFDGAAAAAPVAGLLSIRRLHRRSPPSKDAFHLPPDEDMK